MNVCQYCKNTGHLARFRVPGWMGRHITVHSFKETVVKLRSIKKQAVLEANEWAFMMADSMLGNIFVVPCEAPHLTQEEIKK